MSPRAIPFRISARAVPWVLLLALSACVSQLNAATLKGRVIDPSGGVVPDAPVTLLGALGSLEERRTDAAGTYEFDDLPQGRYKLLCNVPGFASVSSDAYLSRNESAVRDLHLQISAVPQQVVVSASLEPAVEPEVGSSVDVVTQKEIEDRDAQTVLDVLRGVPGVAVNQSGRRGGVTGVLIRGGNSDYNLVMVDGIELNQFGGDFDFASLPADGVDQVEIIRGPESALYGSNAVAGVINIVSRTGEGPPHFTALAEGGSFTTRRFAFGGSGLTRNLGWSFDLSRLDSGGVVPNDNYRNQSALFSLQYSRNPRRQAGFHFFGNANSAGAPGPFGSDPLHLFTGIDRISRDKQNLFGYEWNYAEQFSPRFRQVATGSLAANDLYFRSPYGDSFSNNLRGVVNTRSEISISNQDLFIAGIEYNREQIKNTYIANTANEPFLLPRTSFAYFAENRWTPTARLSVVAGLRLDDIHTHRLPPDEFGLRPLLPSRSVAKVSPRAALSYTLRGSGSSSWLGASRAHGSFGTGIRPPSGFELAFTNNFHLKPEQNISFDSGVEQRLFHDRGVIDLTYFYNRFKDQIVVLGGSLTHLSSFQSDNLANSRTQGLEASLRLHPTRSLEFFGEYTRLNSAILALSGTSLVEAPFHVGQPLVHRPRNSAGWNLTWHHRRLMLNLNGYVRGPVLDVEPNYGLSEGLFRNKGYTLVNGGFSYRLARQVEVYGRLNNLLNQKYEEALGYPALHLNFLAGMRFSFPAE